MATVKQPAECDNHCHYRFKDGICKHLLMTSGSAEKSQYDIAPIGVYLWCIKPGSLALQLAMR